MKFNILFCTYFQRIEKFRYTAETYTDCTVFVPKSGVFSYTCGSASGTLSEGSAFICPPGVPFERSIITPIELCMIKIAASASLSDFSGRAIQVSDSIRLNADLDHLRSCSFCFDFSQHPQFAHFATDIMYLLTESRKNEKELSTHPYILTHFKEDINIAELAKQEGYTSAHFINLFKKLYGCTPKAYITMLRINLAKELLLSTNAPLKEIAHSCGFSDEFYFMRCFKAHTGISAGSFRKMSL